MIFMALILDAITNCYRENIKGPRTDLCGSPTVRTWESRMNKDYGEGRTTEVGENRVTQCLSQVHLVYILKGSLWPMYWE